ncbi:RE1 [Symbiodinium sp. CCMP2592]|nr:RE1 [Symbiodinium sp. CCMP2592]
MMSALVSEQPKMSATEAFARAIWASNNRDQYHGYSPPQHAFGRAPNEFGQLGESKLRDVPVLTEHGVSAEFGVDVKAMFTAEKAFLEEQARERLRRAELSGARTMRHFCPGDLVYAWRRMTPKADGNKHFKGGRFVGGWSGNKRQETKGDPNTQKAGSESESEGEVEVRPNGDCGMVMEDEENSFWSKEGAAMEFSVGLPKLKSKQGKEWSRDLGCFFVKQLRRQAVEISERHLSEKEREGFRGAKQKEVKNFIAAKAFQAMPEGMKPSRSQILKMRWILTWKLDENPEGEPLKKDSQGNALKPKARAVVLGYMDPLYEHRPTSSPTMSRTTRQLFLQSCANKGFTVEKGDISGAFLQGGDFGPERVMACEPLPEICAALGVPEQSTMLLTKAAYGLVEAPIQWFLSISRFLESIGGEQQLSDPCCWSFFKPERDSQGRRICIGHVCGHVDDFLFGGLDSCSEWQAIKEKIQTRFKWGQWETKRFTQCGVLIEQDENGFALSQPEYLEAVTEIHVGRSRWNEPEAPINHVELHQLRSVLGALSWHATQVAPQWSAPVSLLLSKIHQGTVNDIIETNKLLRKAKLGQHQKLLIHRQESPTPLIAAWADAANSNRPDGGSTKGVFVGWTSEDLLKGNLVSISPIFWQSAKIQRACRSSAAAETHAAVDAEDELYAIRLQVSEFLGERIQLWSCDESVKMVKGVLVTDSKNVYDRLNRTVMTFRGAEKRADIESLCLKESMNATGLMLRWVNGDSQLANSLTKETELHQLFEYHRRKGQWRIVYDPELLSGRKRKQLGVDRLAQVAE